MLPGLRVRFSLSNRNLLLTAAACNVVVIVLCFVVYGMNVEGAGAATRNTARFAICFFLAGFAAPGIRKWLPWYSQPATLIHAFVAAQMVHFCSVIVLHTKFAAAPLQLGVPEIAVVLVGFSIVVGAGRSSLANGYSSISMPRKDSATSPPPTSSMRPLSCVHPRSGHF
jgi:hypothetical protein